MSKDKPDQPTYAPQKTTSELEMAMLPKVKELASMPYESWLQRFTVPEEPLSTQAAQQMTGLLGTDYTPTSYEDYLKQIKPEGELYEGAMTGYKGLIGEDYGTEDYKKIEQDYLDTVLGRYEETRGKGRERLQESLISENLLGSGPGYGLMGEYGEETARGVGDISKQWAYEGIQREMVQRQYQDALKRGDYASMYSIALQEANTKMKAEEMANMEKTYYEALERGDIETAFNMGQLLKQAAQYPAQAATQAELGGLQPGLGLFGTMVGRDTSIFGTRMQGYGTEMDYAAKIREQNIGLAKDVAGGVGQAMAMSSKRYKKNIKLWGKPSIYLTN